LEKKGAAKAPAAAPDLLPNEQAGAPPETPADESPATADRKPAGPEGESPIIEETDIDYDDSDLEMERPPEEQQERKGKERRLELHDG
jgi:hypothetical protein